MVGGTQAYISEGRMVICVSKITWCAEGKPVLPVLFLLDSNI